MHLCYSGRVEGGGWAVGCACNQRFWRFLPLSPAVVGSLGTPGMFVVGRVSVQDWGLFYAQQHAQGTGRGGGRVRVETPGALPVSC